VISTGPGDGRQAVHRLSRRLRRILGIRLHLVGSVPRAGLIVCNHLSTIDIVILASTAPTVFVAKDDVRSWFVFGWFARRSGTLFVARDRAAAAVRSVREIRAALAAGNRVVLFPEGTSSGGQTVLPFKSSLLEAGRGHLIWAAALEYSLEVGEGDPAEEICYWKDMSLVGHLLRVLGRRRILATIAFAPLDETQSDRKTLARRAHALVIDLKARRYPGRARSPKAITC
jgi:1-acyl-sn-glycerol-3-phosphate acyltransferase